MTTGAAPSYGWYGDDFTGATDTLATIAKRGKRAFLFLSVPDERRLAEVGPLDAIGIAGAARAMGPAEMAVELDPVGRFFQKAGVRVLHYKCCSTFDSAKEVGNLATAIATLRPYVDLHEAAVIGGQPSLGRYCAFSNLFAQGEGAVHRLDRHPIMSRHPATPMTEADLGRHLQNLGLGKVATVHWPQLEADQDADVLKGESAAVLFDALHQDHVTAIGAVLRRAAREKSMLVVGASSVAEAVFAGDASSSEQRVHSSPGDGPVLAFAGSLSPLTRRQVAAANSYQRVQLDPGQLTASDSYREQIAVQASASLSQGRNVLLATTPSDDTSPVHSGGGLAQSSATLIDSILKRHPVRRLAVAGGDTSSRITQSLGFWGLAYDSQVADGVTLSRSRSDDTARDGMLLMLKGGQMGDDLLFERFLG